MKRNKQKKKKGKKKKREKLVKLYVNNMIYEKKLATIDLMHMTSQKGAQARWGSNVALPRAPSPSMQPAGQPLHAIPPGWPGPAH